MTLAFWESEYVVYVDVSGLIGRRTPMDATLRTDADVADYFLEGGVALVPGGRLQRQSLHPAVLRLFGRGGRRGLRPHCRGLLKIAQVRGDEDAVTL